MCRIRLRPTDSAYLALIAVILIGSTAGLIWLTKNLS
jgi:hypothetical protein